MSASLLARRDVRRDVGRVVRRRVLSAVLAPLVACWALPAGSLAAQSAPAPATKPTVAVLYFTNGAFGAAAEYAPLSKGLAEMLITELSGNSNIRVVERDRLQTLLDEQNLATANRVEPGTAAKIGKLLGALHMLMGTFVVDPKGQMRMDVRAINTETSELEYATSVTGKADRMLELLGQLGTKVNTGLKLPAPPASFQPGQQVGAKGGNQLKSMMLLSRALEARDRKDQGQAVALMQQAVEANPDNVRAKMLLASLERGTP